MIRRVTAAWSDLLLRLRALLWHKRAESELDEELSFHLEMEARKNRSAGMTDAAAQQEATVQFGGVEQVREKCRDVRGLAFLESLMRDLRLAARLLRKSPLFTGVAVASLAIGIGANTAVFSLIDTVLLRMLRVRNPEQLVVARWGVQNSIGVSTTWATGGRDSQGGWVTNVFSWAIFQQMRSQSQAMTDVIGFSPLGPINVGSAGHALTAGGMVASGNYFSGLGVTPILGRAFTADDESADGVPVAVVSYRFWDRALGLDPAIVGKMLYVNGQPCTVIGVTPKDFYGVSRGGFMRTPEIDVTLPIRWRERFEGSGRSRRVDWFGDDLFWVQVIGRLPRPGLTERSKSEWSAAIVANLPEDAKRELATAVPRVHFDAGGQGLDSLRKTYRQPLMVLMVVVGLTLLMACANLAGLLLARATARQREIMVRLAIGASRWRLVRQLLVEGALLSGIGAAVGTAVAWWGVKTLVALMSSGHSPIPITVSPDPRVLVFTVTVALLTTFLFALAPALRATRVDVAAGLKEDVSTGENMGWMGMGRALITVQVAVALVLVSGATLFTRSLLNVRSLPLGFNPQHLVLFDLAPGKNGYDETRGNQVYSQVMERLNQTPGVVGATLAQSRLISGYMAASSIVLEGSRQQDKVNSMLNFVGPDFFDVMQMPLTLGRGLGQRDADGAAPAVAVVNQTLARKLGEGSPIGKKFRWTYGKTDVSVEIVGVVKDAKYEQLRGQMPGTLYAPYTQCPFGWPQEMSFAVRVAGDASAAIAAMRRTVAEIDPMLPLTDVKTQEAQIDDTLTQERMFAWLVTLFSAIVLMLACVGLYGAAAYSVTHRTRELGIRIALGAGRARVLTMLLGQVVVTVALGLLIGVPAAWVLARMIESRLYGIEPHDPLSLVLASVGVALVALLAAFVPSRRATRIDPVTSLRYQ